MINLNTITKEEFVNELIISNDVAEFYNSRFTPLESDMDEIEMVIKEYLIKDIQAELSNHYHPMIYKNGYPINAVPKAIILSLPHLMR